MLELRVELVLEESWRVLEESWRELERSWRRVGELEEIEWRDS